MTFDAPFVLLCAPVIGGALWFAAAWARRVRIRRARRWSVETERTARASGRLVPTALSVAAFLGTVALSGPRWGEERIVAETRGLNLVVAMDISRSMLAEDAAPSRMARAIREARRLVQDLDGDRLGLIAFAGQSYILSPLSVDASALELNLDALEPDVASEGGTALAPVLQQGRELVEAGSPLADRVLVVFTDGEAHDSLPDVLLAARRVADNGVHLVLVAEGGRPPARIPVRDDRGQLQGWQQDENGVVIQTARRDDVLGAVADAAQGTLVAADLPDQAGAVRDLVASYKRSRSTESRAERGRPRAWIPLTLAAALLLWASVAGRTAALIGLALVVGALYNLGLLALREARADSGVREAHLADAERAYHEALLLKPHHLPAKWNLELAIREKRGGGGSQAPRPNSGRAGGGETSPASPQPQQNPIAGQLSQERATEILNSIGEEELRTRKDRSGRARQAAERGVKNW